MAPTGLSVFNVSGSRPAAEAPEKKAAPKPRPKRAAAARETPVPRPPKPPAPDASTPSPFKMLIVSKEAFGASVIGKLPNDPPEVEPGRASRRDRVVE